MGREAALKSATAVYLLHRTCRFCCRFPADRRQAGLLRPAARIKTVRKQVRPYRNLRMALFGWRTSIRWERTVPRVFRVLVLPALVGARLAREVDDALCQANHVGSFAGKPRSYRFRAWRCLWGADHIDGRRAVGHGARLTAPVAGDHHGVEGLVVAVGGVAVGG
jgi:hypothetical protein